jgi:membrane-bound ClpP family serine protease
MTKETLSARINEETESELEDYADSLSISKSEATDRLLHKAIKIENGDVEIVPIRSDGGQIEDRIHDTENQLEELSSQLEEDVTKNKLSYVFLAIGLAYIMIQLSVGLPTVLGIISGSLIIVALLGVNLLR